MITLEHLTNLSSAVPWGLWVSIYVWLIGISLAAYAVMMTGQAFKVEEVKRGVALKVVCISIATLLVGLLSILIDLGHIERFHLLFTSFNPTSVMSWMVMLYNFFLVVLVITFLLLAKKKRIPSTFCGLTAVFALGLIILESFLFAGPPGKLWHSPVFLLHFLATALLSGSAAILCFTSVAGPKKEAPKEQFIFRTTLTLLVISLILELAELLHLKGFNQVNGIYLIGAYIVGLGLLLVPHPVTRIASSFVIIFNVLASKYNSIVSAQTVEPFKEFSRAFMDQKLTYGYRPNSLEWTASFVLMLLAVILSILLYLFYKLVFAPRKKEA